LNIEFECDLEIDNRTLRVVVESEGSFNTDNYGADADGRRGEMRLEIDEVAIKVFDFRGNEITAKLEKKWLRKYNGILEKAEEKLFEAKMEEVCSKTCRK